MAKIKVLLEASAKDRSVRKWLSEATKLADEFTAAADRARASLTQLGQAGGSFGPIGTAGGMPGTGGGGRGPRASDLRRRGEAFGQVRGRRDRGDRGGVPTFDRALAGAQRSRASAVKREASAAKREAKLVDRRIAAMAKAGQQEARADKRRLKAANRAARNIENLSDEQVQEIETQREINNRRRRAARSAAKQQLGPDQTPRAGGSHRRFEMAENLAVASGEFEQVADKIEQGVTASLTSFRDFEKGVVEVSTLTDDISIEEIQKITKDAAAQFGGLPTDQVTAFYSIVSAGATDATSAQEQLNAANKLAIAGAASQEGSVLAISKAVANFGSQGVNATKASDSLFAAVQKGQTTVEGMARALPIMAQAAATAGFTIDETNAAIAVLSKRFPTATEGASALRQALSNIAKPSKAARDEAEELGIDFSTAGIKAAGGIEEFLLKLRSAEKFDEDTLAKLFKSTEARAAIGGLIDGLDEFNETIAFVEDSSGSAEKAFTKMADTSAQKAERLKAKMELLKIQAGEALIPAMTELAEAAEPVITGLITMIRENPRTAKTVAALALGVLGLTRVVGGVATAMSLYNTLAGLAATKTAAMGASTAAASTSVTKYGKAVGGASGALGAVPAIAAGAGLAILAFNATLDQAARGLGILEDGIKSVEEEQQKISFKTPEGKDKAEGTLERERLNRQIAIVNAARQAESSGLKGGATQDSNVLELGLAGGARILNEVTGVQDELTRTRERAEKDLERLALEQQRGGSLSVSAAQQFVIPGGETAGGLSALQDLVEGIQQVVNNTAPPTAAGPSMESGLA